MNLAGRPTLAIKRLTDAAEGLIEGIASTFDVDRQGDQVFPGAFARSIEAFNNGRLVLPLLLDHGLPIGSVRALRETDAGLIASAQLALGTPEAARVFELAKAGPVPLSLQFTMRGDDYQVGADGIRRISGVDLIEISVVTIAANAGAATTSVKGGGEWSEIEHALRDRRGLSARAAKRFVAEGRRALNDLPDDDPSDSVAAILALAATIKCWRT